MNTQRKFSGVLASSNGTGELSLTVASASQFIIGIAATWAAIHGLDASAVTSQVQGIIDTVVTGVTAGYTAWNALATVWGLIRKIYYTLGAKPVAPTA
jgi:hypothetical protein